MFQGTTSVYCESIFDGLGVFHNPHAANPLDWRVFEQPGVFQATYTDPLTQSWQYSVDTPPVVARNLITFNVAGVNLEELPERTTDIPKGGWYKMPFSQATLEAIASNQRGDDIPDFTTTP